MAWTAKVGFIGHPGEGAPEKRWEAGDAITDADAKALGLDDKPELATQGKKGVTGEAGNP